MLPNLGCCYIILSKPRTFHCTQSIRLTIYTNTSQQEHVQFVYQSMIPDRCLHEKTSKLGAQPHAVVSSAFKDNSQLILGHSKDRQCSSCLLLMLI